MRRPPVIRVRFARCTVISLQRRLVLDMLRGVRAHSAQEDHMDDLRRMHYVTEHYEQLQGLRLLPLGVPFLLSSLWRLTRPGPAPFLSASGWAVLLASAIVVPALIGRYYSRHFGHTHPLRWRPAPPLFAVT